ncbi:DDT domain-containing protein DDR4 isoform X3 [Cynara cardunculus var. scolymus]|uniref:DDT domain-containing protein DDR4 isoform X3 n=1 Tax=Cynara cardunculus var. scolymus TaxID=59895 RepID=UPI000D62F895|nr:DDT domain-containing protein DDR4 isoform X3 [Cynara cardunculus var. scolymus]
MSDEQPSSPPIPSDDEIKNNNNQTNGNNVVVRRERPSRACTARSAARLYEAAAAEAAAVAAVRKKKPRRRPSRREMEEEDEEEEEEPPPSPPNPYSKIVTPLVAEPPPSLLPRWNIRSMWELASILNFLNVFRDLLNIKAEFSVEELETALISPNNTLGEIHIPLLKQDDIRSYIDDSIKHGVPLSAFRKERTGGDSHGVSYWYEDDPNIGQRLYREIRKVEVKKGKGKNVQSVSSYQWETVSTNLDEFQDVSEKLFTSKNRTEASLGKKLKNDMLPEIEKVQKRKEKLLKKQHRQAILLDGMVVDGLGPGRSLRGRKQVSYTFDDYDRSINEAIKITKRKQPSPEPSVRREGLRQDASVNGRWGASTPLHNSHNASFTPPSPDSLNDDVSDEDRKSEQLDRSNRRRQRPQRYSAREFVEAVSDNEADMDTDDDDDDDDDIVGEAVYDEEYLKRRKERRKMSSSSEGDEEYRWDGDNAEDEEDEDEGDESLSASEESDDSPRRIKKLPGRTRRETKLRSVAEFKSGPRRSRRATRNRIDYKQYEFSDTEPESTKAETSSSSDKHTEASEKSDKSGFSMGSSEDSEVPNNDNENDDDNDNYTEEMKIVEPVIQENPKIEEEEQKMKLDDSPVEEEFENGAQKRRFLDLNELAPGSGFEDGPMKDDDADNFGM